MKKRRIRYKRIIIVLLIIFISTYYIVVNSYFKVTLKKDTFLIKENYYNDFKATFKGKDVTDKVIVNQNVFSNKIGRYQVEFKYSVNNKEYSEVKTIKIIDVNKPKLELNKASNIKLEINQKYQEFGYTAIDDYDGDITSKVKITGKVNEKKEGVYTLKYSVEDSSGNRTVTKRKITVVKESLLDLDIKDFNLDGYYLDANLPLSFVSNEYKDNFVFIGDNSINVYNLYNLIDTYQIWYKEKIDFKNINSEIFTVRENESLSLIFAFKKFRPLYAIISFSSENLIFLEEDKVIEYYKLLIGNIRKVSPNTILIVQSILPILAQTDNVTNKKINNINYKLLRLCSEEKIHFLNTAKSLKYDTGNLKNEYYNLNESLLSKQGALIVYDYFINHQYKD